MLLQKPGIFSQFWNKLTIEVFSLTCYCAYWLTVLAYSEIWFNWGIISQICFTCAFPSVTSQNISWEWDIFSMLLIIGGFAYWDKVKQGNVIKITCVGLLWAFKASTHLCPTPAGIFT